MKLVHSRFQIICVLHVVNLWNSPPQGVAETNDFIRFKSGLHKFMQDTTISGH